VENRAKRDLLCAKIVLPDSMVQVAKNVLLENFVPMVMQQMSAKHVIVENTKMRIRWHRACRVFR
jgi:hypothetical protein